MIIVPFISLALSWVSARGLKVNVAFDSPVVVKKEETHCRIELVNLGFTGFSGVKLVYDDGRERFLDVSARGRAWESFPVWFPYRGAYTVGVKHIEYFDALGLFCLRKNIRATAEIKVYPRVVEPEDAELVKTLVNQAQTQARITEDDYTNVSDVRKYTDTDSVKKIHWKLSAKRGELIVKNYQSAFNNKISFLMDISNATIDVNDALVESVISLMDKLLRSNTQVELAFGNEQLIKLTANDHSEFHEIYTRVAELKFINGMELGTALMNYTKEQDGFCTVAVFTHRLSGALYEAVLAAKAQGFSIALLYFARNGVFRREAEILNRLEAVGVQVKMNIIGL